MKPSREDLTLAAKAAVKLLHARGKKNFASFTEIDWAALAHCEPTLFWFLVRCTTNPEGFVGCLPELSTRDENLAASLTVLILSLNAEAVANNQEKLERILRKVTYHCPETLSKVVKGMGERLDALFAEEVEVAE